MKKIALSLLAFCMAYGVYADDEPTRVNGHQVETFKLLIAAQRPAPAGTPVSQDYLELKLDKINHLATLTEVLRPNEVSGGGDLDIKELRQGKREYSLGEWEYKDASHKAKSVKLLSGSKKYDSLVISDLRELNIPHDFDLVVHEKVKQRRELVEHAYFGTIFTPDPVVDGAPNPAFTNCTKLEGKVRMLTDKVNNKLGFCRLGGLGGDAPLIEAYTFYRATVRKERPLATEKYLEHPKVVLPYDLLYNPELAAQRYCEHPAVGGKIEEYKMRPLPMEKLELVSVCVFKNDSSKIGAQTLYNGPNARPNAELTRILKNAKE